MYRPAMPRLLLLLCCGLGACAVDVPPQEVETVDVTQSALTEDGCRSPRPPIRGCRVACKPCLIPECVDGKWVYERQEWDGCDSDPLPGGSCCQVPLSGGCPAECHCCNYN